MANPDDQIIQALRSLSIEQGDRMFIRLADLRTRLADIARDELDDALDRMYRTERINLIPYSSPQQINDADREARFRIGGEYKHLASVIDR